MADLKCNGQKLGENQGSISALGGGGKSFKQKRMINSDSFSLGIKRIETRTCTLDFTAEQGMAEV